MNLRPSQIKGHDGKTADPPAGTSPRIPKASMISKTPFINSAVSVCGTCGSHDGHSGRPGKKIDGSWTCRTCHQTNVINGGRGYTFQGLN